MAEYSYFFNATHVSEDGKEADIEYGANDFCKYFATVFSNGVFNEASDSCQVMANGIPDMNVYESIGRANIKGHFYENTTNLVLPIEAADGVLDRIDLIVLRLEQTKIKAYVKKGTFASNPVAPTVERSSDYYELALAEVRVNHGAISITQSAITDLRMNTEKCGLVIGNVGEADTTTFLNQFTTLAKEKMNMKESEFNTWFATIQNTLSGDTAGNLLNLVNARVKYDDMEPKVTTGTADSYTVTIVESMKEVTIVPHVANLEGATLNGYPILDGDNEPITANVLKPNIPCKLVRVGTNFFICSGSGGTKKVNAIDYIYYPNGRNYENYVVTNIIKNKVYGYQEYVDKRDYVRYRAVCINAVDGTVLKTKDYTEKIMFANDDFYLTHDSGSMYVTKYYWDSTNSKSYTFGFEPNTGGVMCGYDEEENACYLYDYYKSENTLYKLDLATKTVTTIATTKSIYITSATPVQRDGKLIGWMVSNVFIDKLFTKIKNLNNIFFRCCPDKIL